MVQESIKKRVVVVVAIAAIGQMIFQFLAFILFPPDFTTEFPIYPPESIMILQFAMVFMIIELTIFGMKAEEEKDILAAAGFTAMAISMGIGAAGLLELVQGTDEESYEMFYFLNCCSNFIYVPGMLLIATYSKFKLWIRIGGILTSIPLFIVTMLFLFKNRDYALLEAISNTGYLMLMILQLAWAWNVYSNYKKEKNTASNTN